MFHGESLQQMTLSVGGLGTETETWLREHGASITSIKDLHVIELNRPLSLYRGPFLDCHCIHLAGARDERFLLYELSADCKNSVLTVVDRL